MSKLLTVENLNISLCKPDKELVQDINFSLGAGESLILLGQSGSGKTMTCGAIMGLLDPKRFKVEGSIFFEKRRLTTLTSKEKQNIYGGTIAMIPQNPMTALDPSMKIGKQMMETLAIHSNLEKRLRKAKVEESLQATGLNNPKEIYNSYPYMLSGGMLQRVLIAMALIVDAKLIIADEPTTALDVVHRNSTVDEFLSLKRKGVAILMVTHDFASAVQMGGNLIVMKDGQILERGQVDTILANPKHPYTKALIGASRLSHWVTGEENNITC